MDAATRLAVGSERNPASCSLQFATTVFPAVRLTQFGPQLSIGGEKERSLVIGQVLGHCRITAKIGEGGMGVVYRAYDEVLHRDVAVKVVKKDPRLDTSASQNLLHEARASSALAHPNICTIYDVGETDGDLYIVMELVEGKSLQTLTAGAGLPVESILRYGIQIASALSRAHDRGIIHRDLKGSNIVATP